MFMPTFPNCQDEGRSNIYFSFRAGVHPGKGSLGATTARVSKFSWESISLTYSEDGQVAVRTRLPGSLVPWTFTLFLAISPDCSRCSPGTSSKGPQKMLPFPYSFLGRWTIKAVLYTLIESNLKSLRFVASKCNSWPWMLHWREKKILQRTVTEIWMVEEIKVLYQC